MFPTGVERSITRAWPLAPMGPGAPEGSGAGAHLAGCALEPPIPGALDMAVVVVKHLTETFDFSWSAADGPGNRRGSNR